MPSVDLTVLYLHDASDLTVYVTLDGGTETAPTAKPGALRRMANGRVRAVTRAGASRSIGINAPFVAQATYDTIEDWVEAGTLLMLRDAKRRVRWGHIFSLDTQVSQATEESMSFTFECITHVEEV